MTRIQDDMKKSLLRILASLFVFGNAAGVVPIAGMPGVYRPHEFNDWITSITATPSAHIASSLLFLLGAFSGIALGRLLINTKQIWAGTFLMLGAGWNALFIPIPLILAQLASRGHDIQGIGVEIAMSLAIFADAMFNGFMGLSMILLGLALRETRVKLGYAGIIIGGLTMCIAGQFEYTACADMLKVAGPLWLGWWMCWGWTNPSQHQS